MRVVDKNWEGYHRSEGSQPHTGPPSPGFQCQEDKSPQLLAVKTSGGLGSGRNWDSQAAPLKGSERTQDLHRLTPSGLQHQSSSWKGTSARGEQLKCLASG